MALLYVTTSRNPCSATRLLARWLALLLGAMYENRGKRSIAEIEERMQRLGARRALFVYEKGGAPVTLAVYDPRRGWLTPEFAIQVLELPPCARPQLPRDIAIDSDAPSAQTAQQLVTQLGLEEPETEDCVRLRIQQGVLTAFYGKLIGPKLYITLSRPRMQQRATSHTSAEA